MFDEKEETHAMNIQQNMDISEKLKILTDAAKYDVACTSSGVDRGNNGKGMGNTYACGICHSFASDGRCVSLLKILYTNECIYDCKYCINRRSNDVPRASFTPDEVCRLTMEFYRRNYIEGLFLSSGILKSPDYRMSTNLELPTRKGLEELAPNKSHKNMLRSMRQIQLGSGNLIASSSDGYQLVTRSGRQQKSKFVPAGQSTQMIIGATPETDYQLMTVTEYMYKEYKMKRVFYSAFVDVNHNIDAPAPIGPNPLLREHRLYQADWLLRYYNFEVKELLNEKHPNFNVVLDPKCDWAINHLEKFPVEVMRADYYTLLRVPGLGVRSARRIVSARRYGVLDFGSLKKMGVVLKRAAYFITCNGKTMFPLKMNQDFIARALANVDRKQTFAIEEDTTYKQMTLMDLEAKV